MSSTAEKRVLGQAPTGSMGRLFPGWASLCAFRVSISTVLAGFALAVFSLAGAVLYLSFDNARDSSRKTIDDKVELFVEAVVRRTREHLNPVEEQARHLVRMMAAGELDSTLPDAFAQDLRIAMTAMPQVRAMAFIDSHGKVIRVFHDTEKGRGRVDVIDWSDDAGVQADLEQAQGATSPYWSDFFFAESSGTTYLNLRAPVRRDGRFIGMLVVVVSVLDLARFVDQLGTDQWDNAYILADRRHVLAFSRWRPEAVSLSDGQPLPRIDQVGDPILARIWEPSESSWVPSLPVGNFQGHVSNIDGEDYAFLYQSLAGYGPEPWIVGFYIRLDTLTGPLRQLWVAAALGLGALALFGIVGITFGRRLGATVHRFGHLADRVRTMDLEISPLEGSRIRELDDAATAFNSLVSGLQGIRGYLPSSLVRRLVKQEGVAEIKPVVQEVTVLFTDIVGFTTMAAELSPGEVADFLNEHFTLIAEGIELQAGTIDKFIGDGLMAFWGAPDSQSDHAERAFQAALGVASTVRSDNARRRREGLPPVRMTIGLHTGVALTGNIGSPGRVNYTIIGDTVNTAQRIERLSRDLDFPETDVTILVSASTAKVLGDGLEPFTAGTHVLRGRGEPIEIYRIA